MAFQGYMNFSGQDMLYITSAKCSKKANSAFHLRVFQNCGFSSCFRRIVKTRDFKQKKGNVLGLPLLNCSNLKSSKDNFVKVRYMHLIHSVNPFQQKIQIMSFEINL